ncbi:MAG: HD domain-containing phosphohydrolase [Candidatus Krumholzibacteriota bacterium]
MATRFSDLIILLSGGINQRRMYFDSHPKVQHLGRDFADRMREVLADKGETGFFFGILNGKFIRDGKYLIGPSIAGRNLIDFADRLQCGGFLFRQGVDADEVMAFFRVAANTRDKVGSIEESMALFHSAGIRNIEVSPYFREGEEVDANGVKLAPFDPGVIQFDFSDDDGEGDGRGKSVSQELEPLLPIFQSMYETVQTNNIHINMQQDVDVTKAMGVGEELFGVSDRQTMDVMNLMRYPDYDSYTIGHSVRVSTLALTVGREMGWPEHLLSELATAGLLHDIGKAKVPDEILYKPGKLNPEERKIAESHAAIGAKILLAKGDASPLMIAGAWGHHIRHDGNGGYPDVPEWAVKSPIAGLLHVCDVFEALTAARPYKSPMPPRRAFEIILKDKGSFDPAPLTALIRAIGLYPPGSEVALSDGTRGYVIAKGPDWQLPTVRVTSDPEGRTLAKEDQYVARLHEEENLSVADFLMVGLDPDAAKHMNEEDAQPQEETGGEWEEGLANELDDIFEESNI